MPAQDQRGQQSSTRDLPCTGDPGQLACLAIASRYWRQTTPMIMNPRSVAAVRWRPCKSLRREAAAGSSTASNSLAGRAATSIAAGVPAPARALLHPRKSNAIGSPPRPARHEAAPPGSPRSGARSRWRRLRREEVVSRVPPRKGPAGRRGARAEGTRRTRHLTLGVWRVGLRTGRRVG